MKKYLALAALMASVATPALAQYAPGMPMMAPGAPMMAPMAPMTTESFRQMAMASDAFEIESGRLALERSRNPAIRRFAQRMIQDHAMTSQALNGGVAVYNTGGAAGGAVTGTAVGAGVGFLAGGPVGAAIGAGVGAATGATAGAAPGSMAAAAGVTLDARHADMLNQLAAASGRQFDSLYAQLQVAAHQEAVAMYAAYAQGGTDPNMRTFTQQALPQLQQHLAMAERLAGGRMRGQHGMRGMRGGMQGMHGM